MTEEQTEDLRAEVVQQLRMLGMGRLNAANRLAELLVPSKPAEPALVLPVIDAAMLQAGPSSGAKLEHLNGPKIAPAKKAKAK